MNMKKSLVVGVALTMVASLGLAGCGSNGGVEKTEDGKIKITMWHGFSEADGKTLEGIVDDFNNSQDEYFIDAQLQPWSTIGETMVTKVTSGDGPDFVTTGADNGQGWSLDGTFQCVTDFYDDPENETENYIPNVVDQITFDIDGSEEKCAVPMGYAPTAVWYNTDMWAEAGLTDADYPTTWDELADAAQKLTSGDRKGLTFSGEYARIGVFMKQAGGGLVDDAGTTAIANNEESVAGLEEVKTLLDSGVAAYAADLGTGWGGEAFGSGKAAMAIEGNWLTGSMSVDYPDVNYKVVELPAGPAGKGTMHFTNGWGIAADSPNQEGAIDLVEYLTSDDVVMDFAEAFGIMPATTTLADAWKEANPELGAFMDGLEYSVTVPTAQGAADVIADFNAQLEGLHNGDAKSILDSVQTNLEAIL